MSMSQPHAQSSLLKLQTRIIRDAKPYIYHCA